MYRIYSMTDPNYNPGIPYPFHPYRRRCSCLRHILVATQRQFTISSHGWCSIHMAQVCVHVSPNNVTPDSHKIHIPPFVHVSQRR